MKHMISAQKPLDETWSLDHDAQADKNGIHAGGLGDILWVVIAAFLIRFVVVLLVYRDTALSGVNHDQFGWEMGWVARSIALGHGFSSPFVPFTGATALVPPLYPYLLAGVFRCFGLYSVFSAFVALSLNSICSALTCIPVFLLARQLGGARNGKLAAAIWAVYPFSIYFSATHVWDYALTALLLAACWYLAQQVGRKASAKGAAGLGALFGVAALSNPSVLSMFLVAVGFAMWRIFRLKGKWLRFGLITALSTCSVLLPWSIRNTNVLHANVPLRDGFWLEFYAGNHGDTSTSNPPSSHPASNAAEMTLYRRLGEISYIDQKKSLGLAYVAQHPLQFAEVSFRRALRFWTGFWSFSPSYLWDEQLDVPNVFFCSAITLLMLRGVFRSWKNSREATVPTILMLILFPLTYYLTHSSMDYRQPIEPEIVVMVALGLPRRFRLKAIGSRERRFFARTPKHTTREPEPAVLVSRA